MTNSKYNLLFALVFFVSLLSFVPSGNAQVEPTDWQKLVISGQTGGLDSLDLSSDGDSGLVGIAALRSDNSILFAKGDANGFTVINLTVAAAADTGLEVYKISDEEWGLIYSSAGTWYFLLSEDGGATWTETHSDTGGSFSISGYDDVVLISAENTAATTLNVHASFDRGLSWGLIYTQTSVLADSTFEIYALDAATYNLYQTTGAGSDGNNLLNRTTTDAGNFWTDYWEIDDGSNNNACAATNPNVEGNGFNIVVEWNYRTGACGSTNTATHYYPEESKFLNNGLNGKNYFDRNENGHIMRITGITPLTAEFAICPPNSCSYSAVDFDSMAPSDVSDIRKSLNLQNNRVFIVYSNDTFGGRLEVLTSVLEESLGPTETETFTGIVGFDVNEEYAIVRTNGGDFVRTLNAESLTEVYTDETNCSRLHGVVALSDGFGYLDCAGDGTVEEMILIDEFGDSYPISQCNESSECSNTIFELNELTGEGDFLDISPVYNNYVFTDDDGSDDSHQTFDFVFGITGTDDNVYALSLVIRDFNTLGDQYEKDTDLDSVVYGEIPSSICSNLAGKVYVVDDALQTRGYTITTNPDEEADVGNQDNWADVEITQSFSGATAINQAVDIDCASGSGGRILVAKTNSLTLYNPLTSTVVWTQPYTGIVKTSISTDAQFGTYTDATTTYVLDMDDGSIITSVDNPSGSMIDTEMDNDGERFWVVSSTTVNYHNVGNFTCQDSCGGGSGGNGGTSTSTSTGGGGFGGGGNEGACGANFLGINIGYVADAWDATETSIRWLLGILLLVLVVYGFAKIGGGAILLGAAVVIGVGGAVAFCLFPVWLLLVIILLIALGVGSAFFNDNNEG